MVQPDNPTSLRVFLSNFGCDVTWADIDAVFAVSKVLLVDESIIWQLAGFEQAEVDFFGFEQTENDLFVVEHTELDFSGFEQTEHDLSVSEIQEFTLFGSELIDWQDLQRDWERLPDRTEAEIGNILDQ